MPSETKETNKHFSSQKKNFFSTCSDKGLMGIVVNRALLSLHAGIITSWPFKNIIILTFTEFINEINVFNINPF